jgi:hypothetical protein
MKKCPTCGKEFEDSMKFCQIDGAELVADEPAFDPYATVVGHKLDLTPEPQQPIESGPSAEASAEETAAVEPLMPAADSPIHETTGSIPSFGIARGGSSEDDVCLGRGNEAGI